MISFLWQQVSSHCEYAWFMMYGYFIFWPEYLILLIYIKATILFRRIFFNLSELLSFLQVTQANKSFSLTLLILKLLTKCTNQDSIIIIQYFYKHIQQFCLPNLTMRTSTMPLPKSTFSPSNRDISTNQSRSDFNPKRYLKPALSEEEIKEIKQIFDVFDTEGRGLINPGELVQALNSVDFNGKENTAYQQLKDLAADGEGEIEFQKFLTMLTTRVTQQDSLVDMKQLFSLFDDQKCGYLTIKTLRRAVREMQVDVSEEQLQKMIEAADFDKNGKVSEEEFYLFMTGKKDQE